MERKEQPQRYRIYGTGKGINHHLVADVEGYGYVTLTQTEKGVQVTMSEGLTSVYATIGGDVDLSVERIVDAICQCVGEWAESHESPAHGKDLQRKIRTLFGHQERISELTTKDCNGDTLKVGDRVFNTKTLDEGVVERIQHGSDAVAVTEDGGIDVVWPLEDTSKSPVAVSDRILPENIIEIRTAHQRIFIDTKTGTVEETISQHS